MIGMSLLCEPSLLIADEPTTALDVTVQAQILELLRAVRAESRMAIVLISHDLLLVANLADRVVVMYGGRVVESGTAAGVLGRPLHPYTAALIECAPRLHGPRQRRMPSLPGQPPSASAEEAGCAFAPRCPRVAERCRAERPLLHEPRTPGHTVACHFPGPP
jgi:peptide/nickel transport system ATP-binding protein